MARCMPAGPSKDGSRFVSVAWATHHQIEKEIADHIFLGRDASEEKDPAVVLSRYDWDESTLSEPKTEFLMEHGAPLKMAVHPGGDGVIISFASSCRQPKLLVLAFGDTWRCVRQRFVATDEICGQLNKGDLRSMYEWEELNENDSRSTKGTSEVELKLVPAVRLLGGLENVRRQNCLTFSTDGSLFASGGEDGRIRVFEWPTMDVIIDIAKAHPHIKDMDFSLDSAFLATTCDNNPCRIWDVASGSGLVMTLPLDAGENFGFCRFSRDGMKPFLFVTMTKEKNGLISVWDMATWRRLGSKKFQDEPITALAISHHGKRLAIGSQTGDISIIEVKKMEVHQRVRFAHLESIDCLEFSPNDKAVLSLSIDCSARVSSVDLSHEWKEWQVWLVLAGMILLSVFLFYLMYAFGDSFWQVPVGKDQPDRSSNEALSYDDFVDYKTDL